MPRCRPPRAAGRSNNGVVGWLQLPDDHPNFGRDFDTAETKLGVDAVKAANPYVDYGSFDVNDDGRLSVSVLARHRDRGRLRDVVRR